jgi:nucleoside-diphosphate-sugar epimerase
MRIFIAGATGAVGKRLVPLLRANGHEVVGTTRSRGKVGDLRGLGAEPVVLDVLDADAVGRAVSEAGPEVVVHQATALSNLTDLRNLDEAFEETNRLRTAGTDNLLAAAKAAGATKLVAQSFAGWPFAKEGSAVKDEEAPLDPSPLPSAAQSMAAIRHLEETVVRAEPIEGIALRYGGFYGPGTSLVEGGEHVEAIRKRKFPVVGSGAGIWSFIHIDDAAGATLAAIDRGRRGLYNIVDDEPAPTAEWLSISPRRSARSRPVTCRNGSDGSWPASSSSR